MKKALLAVTATLLLLFASTACGSGSSNELTKSEQKAAKNLSAYFQEAGSGGTAMKKTDANCLSKKFVGKTGVAKLKKSKLIDKNLKVNKTSTGMDKDVATTFATTYLGCVDYNKELAASQAKSDKTVDAAKLEKCLDKNFSKADEKKVLITGLSGDKPDQTFIDGVNKTVETCLTDSKS